MRRELASLPPLHVPKLLLAKDRQAEEVVSGSLYRKTSQLLDTLYQMSATMKVVDVTRQKTGVSWGGAGRRVLSTLAGWGWEVHAEDKPCVSFFPLHAAVSPAAQLLEQTARLKSMSDTVERLKVTLLGGRAEPRPQAQWP